MSTPSTLGGATPARMYRYAARWSIAIASKAHLLVLGVPYYSLLYRLHNAKRAFCSGHIVIAIYASYTYVRSSVAIGPPWFDPVRSGLTQFDVE